MTRKVEEIVSHIKNNWHPCRYCDGEGTVETKDGRGKTYNQMCPVCCGDKGFGSIVYVVTDDSKSTAKMQGVG